MSDDAIQPSMPQDDANLESQANPLEEVVETGGEMVNETPVEAADQVEAVTSEIETEAKAAAEIVQPVVAEDHPHRKQSLFDKLFGRKEGVVEQPAPEAAAVEVLETAEPTVEPAESPVAPVAPAVGMEAVSTLVHEEVERAQTDLRIAVQEDVKSLVRQEIEVTQSGIQATIQAELARLENDAARKEYEAAQDTMAEFYRSKSGATMAKVELLKQRQAVVFSDTSRPIKEVKEDVGIISEMLAEAQNDLAEVENVVASRAAATSELVTSLGAREQIAALQRQVVEQTEQLTTLGEKVKNGVGGGGKAGFNWWQLLGLAAILLVGIGLSALYLRSSVVNQKPTSLMIETAALYQSSGEVDDAERILDEAVQEGITDPVQLARVGQLYYSLKEYKKAINVLIPAVNKESSNKLYRLTLARSYSKSGNYQDAASQYQKLLELDKQNLTFPLELGGVYEALQQYDKAITQYSEVVRIAPDRIEGYYNLGQVYRNRLQQYDLAAEQYQLALNISPDHYLSRVYYGACLAQMGKYSQALDEYQKALEKYPDLQSAPLYLADTYMMQKKYSDAISWYQRLLELNPNSVPGYIGMGNAYLYQKDCVNAVTYFAEALKVSPTSADAKAGLAQCGNK